MTWSRPVPLLAFAALFFSGRPAAQGVTAPVPSALQGVTIEEHLDAQIPTALEFTGPDGTPYPLARIFDGRRPVVLALVYYRCPMMCGLVLTGMARAMRESGLALGKDFRALTVSFDPADTAGESLPRQRGYLESLGHPEGAADWPFLTGAPPAIAALTRAVGFGYKYDPPSKQFAHPVALFLLTPTGRISRYLYGVEYNPRDLRLGLVEAADGKVGTSVDRFILTCFHYDAAARRYTPYVFGFIRAGGMLVFLALAATLAVFWRRELRNKKRPESP